MQTVRQSQRRQHTRESLLDSAERSFARRGFHGAGLDQICADAGLTKGALYYNFRGKDELLLAVLDRHMSRRLELVESLRGVENPLAEGAARTVRSLRIDRDWSLLFLELSAHAARDPAFRRKFVARLRPVRAAMAGLLQEMTGVGAARAERLALEVEAAVDGIAMRRLLEPAAVPDDLLGSMVAALVRQAGR